jgi:hypothetical protein
MDQKMRRARDELNYIGCNIGEAISLFSNSPPPVFVGSEASEDSRFGALPARIPGCERIDASINANVANEEIRALDKVRYLINRSPTETTSIRCHRRAPLLPYQRHLAFGGQSASGL